MVDKGRSSVGIVGTRQCASCGHQEIGYTTGDGAFHPLRPGTFIQVLEQTEGPRDAETGKALAPMDGKREEEQDRVGGKVWVPSPVLGLKELRLKYGVMVREDIPQDKVTPQIYRIAYLDKLTRLIEKEVYVPLPVLLDRFFTAPHLASGDPKQAAESMWRELNEVRNPVLMVEKWLENQEPCLFEEMARGRGARTAPEEDAPGGEDLLKELNALSLEEFLSLL